MIRIHPDVFDVDLLHLEAICEDEEKFQQIMKVFQKTLNKLMENPKYESSPCRKGQLAAEGYWKCKWFSAHPKPRGQHPDLRLIFKFENGVLYVRGVAFRHFSPGIYEVAAARDF